MKKIFAALTLAAFTMVATPSFAQTPAELPKKEEKKTRKHKSEEKKGEKKHWNSGFLLCVSGPPLAAAALVFSPLGPGNSMPATP